MILQTNRLILREMSQSDYSALCQILQDSEVMYAYEGAFCDSEVQEWLDKQIDRYKTLGFGLWAVILKENGLMIGQCGFAPCMETNLFLFSTTVTVHSVLSNTLRDALSV